MPEVLVIKAYIDIDGVLIRNGKSGPELIPQFCRVLRYLKKNFSCYWLTTHVKSDVGSTGAERKLAGYLKQAKISSRILDGIKPTSWRTLKTEAIDFGQPFVWLDDRPLLAECSILHEKGCFESLAVIDWQKRSARLTVRFLKKYQKKIFNQLKKP